MRTLRMIPSMALTLILLSGLPAMSLAAEGMIMMSGDCPYMVLDTTEGQALIKRVTGPTPETGDILEGKFDPKEFSTLTNRRTQETLKVWVDLVDAHGNRALSRHGNYCS
jgi:hypothetical protein